MNVSQLIEQLQKLEPDRLVILQKDAEGNGYSPLDSLGPCAYIPETSWFGERKLEPHELTDELRAQGYDECDIPTGDYTKAVVLQPVN